MMANSLLALRWDMSLRAYASDSSASKPTCALLLWPQVY
jgi:hypothetical protein